MGKVGYAAVKEVEYKHRECTDVFGYVLDKKSVACMYRIFTRKVQIRKAGLKCDSLVYALLSSVI